MYRNTQEMSVNGLRAIINTPAALHGNGLHSLPPHAPREVHLVDEYPACPANWMHGSSKASSYFLGVEAEVGMWFDFTMNQSHPHHVAVVISVQGINPVTGQPVTELNLMQYRNKCPKHDVEFHQDRFCPQCEFKWPAQNYIATTTGERYLWLDGFRNALGEVRQYIITAEEMRGVAAQHTEIDRVWAIGFAFYISKEPKPKPIMSTPRAEINHWGMMYNKSITPGSYALGDVPLGACETFMHTSSLSSNSVMRSAGTVCDSGFSDRPTTPRAMCQTLKLEIGAGARIQQEVGIDPNSIDFWRAEPEGVIYANYVPTAFANQIVAAGQRATKADGPLNGMRVGN